MNMLQGLRTPATRVAIQLVLAICLGTMTIDVLIGAFGSVRNIGWEDVGWLVAVLVMLFAGLVVGHVLRGRVHLVEALSFPLAFAGVVLYLVIELAGIETDARLAISCVLMASYTASLSLLDAFPGGASIEARRGGLLDDGAVLAVAIVSSALATPVFIGSALVDRGWVTIAAVLGVAGVLELLIVLSARREPMKKELPPLRQRWLVITRAAMMGLGIVVFLVGAFELDWILGELFGSMYMYVVFPQVLVNALILVSALGGCVTGAVAAKACLLATRKPGRIAAAVLLVFVPLLIPGGILWASIVVDWVLPGAVSLFLVAGHVSGLVLQFSDSGYKGTTIVGPSAT